MSKLDVIKAFAKNIGVQAVVGIVRGFFNEQLKDVKPDDLYESIINDRDLWQVTPDTMKTTGKGFKKTWGHYLIKYQNEINTELLLKWVKEDHPDLYSTIINTNIGGNFTGLVWFDRQVTSIKRKILEM